MAQQEGSRWDVSVKEQFVYLERISEGDERVFDDTLAPEEARKLAETLKKFADQADKSEDSDEPKSEGSDDSQDSAKSDDTEDDADKSDD